MEDRMEKIEYIGRERISLGCVIVSAVFFLVLSQAFILRLPDVATQMFRPLIIAIIYIEAKSRGVIKAGYRTSALLAALYCTFVIVLLEQFSVKEMMQGFAIVLYFLMFFAISGVPWNKREIRLIINAVFFATFVCAVVLFISNSPTDLKAARGGDLNILGIPVNRNKNAYAFGIGTVIGMLYLFRGRSTHKLMVALSTAVIAYALLYSQCRGAFICTVAAIMVIALSMIAGEWKHNQGKAIVQAFLLIVVCVAGYYLLKNSELSRLVDGDSTSGRDVGIKEAWQMFLNSDMFGKIFGNGYLYQEQHIDGVGAHLVYVGYLVAVGIIGTGFVVIMFLSAGLKIRGGTAKAFWLFGFLRTFFEGLDYYIYIPLLLAVMIYNYTYLYGRNTYELFSGKQI